VARSYQRVARRPGQQADYAVPPLATYTAHRFLCQHHAEFATDVEACLGDLSQPGGRGEL
jgi:hypothetical protein